MTHLNGSEKQVAWATDIRKEFIEKTKADMKSADKNDVLDMKAMLKVADNITEAADWINARRNVRIMFFDRADFWEARREIKAAEKPAEKEDSGSHAEIITNRHGEGRWLRDSTTGDYIQISGTSQYRLPRTKNALECQLAFRLRR